jgi:hypothetical protein
LTQTYVIAHTAPAISAIASQCRAIHSIQTGIPPSSFFNRRIKPLFGYFAHHSLFLFSEAGLYPSGRLIVCFWVKPYFSCRFTDY